MFTSRKGYTVSPFFFFFLNNDIDYSFIESVGRVSFCLFQSLFFSYYYVDEYSIFSIYVVAQSFFDWSTIYDHIIHTYTYTSGMKRDASQNQLGRGFVDTRKLQLITYTSFIDYYLIIIGFGFRFFLTLFTIMNLVIVLCSGGDFSFSLIGFLFLLFLYEFFLLH